MSRGGWLRWGKSSLPVLLTSGPASTSSFFASSQKVSGKRRRSQQRFLLLLLRAGGCCWPPAVASLTPFSSGRFVCFMLPLCREWNKPLAPHSVKTPLPG